MWAQETEARWFFQQVMIALDYLHRVGVVSRDIKLENTLLDGNRRPLVKICDFGYSKHTEKDSVPKSRVGTPGYTGLSLLYAQIPTLAEPSLERGSGCIAQSCYIYVGRVSGSFDGAVPHVMWGKRRKLSMCDLCLCGVAS